MIFFEMIYQWTIGNNQWPILTMHMTLIFACIVLTTIILFKIGKFKWWDVVVMGLLLFLIIILAPELIMVIVCCVSDIDKIVLILLFFFELMISVSIIVLTIRSHNKKIKKKDP